MGLLRNLIGRIRAALTPRRKRRPSEPPPIHPPVPAPEPRPAGWPDGYTDSDIQSADRIIVKHTPSGSHRTVAGARDRAQLHRLLRMVTIPESPPPGASNQVEDGPNGLPEGWAIVGLFDEQGKDINPSG